MSLRIVTADQRLAEANAKTTMAIFGPSGVGKTSLLKTLPPAETLCIDLEAGMKSVQDWPGDSIPVRSFADALDIACLVGGINPAADEISNIQLLSLRAVPVAPPQRGLERGADPFQGTCG